MTADASDPLAVAAQRGDRGAFEAMIRREKAGIYAFVRRYVRDADDAYDLLQETFVSAWRSIARYDPERPVGVWLRAIALNKCRDHGRRAKVRRLVLGAFSAEPRAPVGPNSNIEDARLARLDEAIASLPSHYRDPLLLTTAGGLSHEDAAKVLKLSAKAVEMRLYRARRKLAELLEEPGEG